MNEPAAKGRNGIWSPAPREKEPRRTRTRSSFGGVFFEGAAGLESLISAGVKPPIGDNGSAATFQRCFEFCLRPGSGETVVSCAARDTGRSSPGPPSLPLRNRVPFRDFGVRRLGRRARGRRSRLRQVGSARVLERENGEAWGGPRWPIWALRGARGGCRVSPTPQTMAPRVP